jgi:hypothetical protein
MQDVDSDDGNGTSERPLKRYRTEDYFSEHRTGFHYYGLTNGVFYTILQEGGDGESLRNVNV